MAGKVDSRKRKSLMAKDNNLKSSKLSSANSQLLQTISNGRHTEVASLLQSSLHQISTKTLDTAVFQIVANGHKHLLQLFIKHGVNSNCKNVKGQTALMVAAQHGYLDLVKLLVRNGADVNSRSKGGKTALLLAAEKACCIPIIEFLISNSCHADVNIQDKVGRTALMMSTHLCDIAAMRVLMHHKETDLDIQDKKGNTALDIAKQNDIHEQFCIIQECIGNQSLNPLMISVTRGDLGLLKEFLDDDFYNIDQTNMNGNTPLILALNSMSHDCKDRNISKDIILTLLKSGANVNKMCMLHTKSCTTRATCTPILCAVELGNLEAVILLVEHGANVNLQTPLSKVSALMVAAQKGFLDILEFLLKKSADIHLKDVNNKVALTYALDNNEICCAELLLQHGAEFDDLNLIRAANLNVDLDKYLLYSTVAKKIASSPMCSILMHRCIDSKNYVLFEFLLYHGTDLNILNGLLLTVIGKDACMTKLLLDKGVMINEVDIHGRTALMIVALGDYGDSVPLLIERGADMNIDCDGNTALTFAIKKQSRNALEALLQCGVDVNYVSEHPLSFIPLHLSILCGCHDIAELLIHYGADINSVDNNIQTPLLLAFRQHNYDIASLLIAKGADLDKQTIGGCTVLHVALMSQDIRMAEMLVRAGANVNVPDDQGKTALMICSQICTTGIMLLLLKSGANVNDVDKSGCSALHHAVKHSILLTEKAEMLLKYGADINKANNDGSTAFMIASRFCKDNVLRFLLEHGANLNAQDKLGSTALVHALALKNERAAFLISIGSDVNIQNNLGQTALTAAADKCDDFTMKALINAGANIHAVDKGKSCNVLSIVLEGYNKCVLCSRGDFACKHIVCLEMLLNAGAIPDIPSQGLLALYKAIICNKLKLVQLLVGCGIQPLEMPRNVELLKCSIPHSFYHAVCGITLNSASFDNFVLAIDASVHARSPLSTAIFCKNAAICHFFINNWFFNEKDMNRQSINMFHDLIAKTRETKLASVCEEIFLQPWSLATLSFVTVSTCIGSSSDREKRIRALPIPPILQEKLLYRGTERDATLTISENEEVVNFVLPAHFPLNIVDSIIDPVFHLEKPSRSRGEEWKMGKSLSPCSRPRQKKKAAKLTALCGPSDRTERAIQIAYRRPIFFIEKNEGQPRK